MNDASTGDPSFGRASLARRLDALFDAAAWQELASHSDLRVVEGRIAGRRVLCIATNPAAAQGTLGVEECVDFRQALDRARATGVPLLLLLDSAGTRLTAGLPVLGAIRALFRDMLEMRCAGVPMLAVLGRHAFGSASMLAFAAHARLYGDDTLLAMSGPRVLEAAPENRATSDVVLSRINGTARAAAGDADASIADTLDAHARAVRRWAVDPPAACVTRETLLEQRRHLRDRLAAGAPDACAGPVLDGDTLRCAAGKPFGAADALALVELAESACLNSASKPLTIAVDTPGHSVLLCDEGVILSQYLVHLSMSLHRLVRQGSPIRVRVTGTVSGGVYIALAAAASTVELAPGATIHTLPNSVLMRIFGDALPEPTDGASYAQWGHGRHAAAARRRSSHDAGIGRPARRPQRVRARRSPCALTTARRERGRRCAVDRLSRDRFAASAELGVLMDCKVACMHIRSVVLICESIKSMFIGYLTSVASLQLDVDIFRISGYQLTN